ncbi:MAG: PH domain-containing protein [Candidatus Saccharibacteria bacterium]|nr:PH domain-containing protein [Candidatus Saccharibacteria bacterium]
MSLTFDGQHEDEEVQFIFRRHFSTAKKGIIFWIICTLIGVGPMLIWRGHSAMFWIFVIAFVVGFIGFMYATMLWYFSIFIVTNERIRQISQKGFFKKSVVDLGIDKIQNTSYEIPGFFAGISHYGTVLIQTSVGDLVISQVKNPERINDLIQETIRNANS